ncbi:DMT family transporter [Treponema sp.]|uniref:DMT family transporter n=1 Tax=Treponema sp. TaxID=166 RepID=UPI0025D0BADB|nr:DMT family transporter [Treponema sp.]MCR5217484.1 DMT family transporter [Treponema sp.]
MNNTNHITGLLFASLAIFIWGITFVCTKYLLKSFSAFEILFIRFILAYLALRLLHRDSIHVKAKKEELYFMLAGFSGVAAYQLLENMALAYTSASNVSIIVSVCPIFAAILSQIILKEKHLTLTFMLGFILSISGIALVSFNGVVVFHLSPKGDLLALSAAVCWGIYSICISKLNAMGFSSMLVTRRVFHWAIIFMIPIAIISLLMNNPSDNLKIFLDAGTNAKRFSDPLNWFNLSFLGLGASAFCFSAWSIACDKLGTIKASLGIYLIPVVTIIFAFFVLGERITLMGAAGSILTIAGLFVSSIKKNSGEVNE